MTRIAILDDYRNVALDVADWNSLPDNVRIDVFNQRIADRAALVDRLQPYQVIVAMRERTPFSREVVARLPNLRLIASLSWRNLAIDLEACKDHGVLVCHTESAGVATAELTWALILCLAKRILVEDAAIRKGLWGAELGIALSGKVLGVIGLGRLGKQVAGVGRHFGMDVIAWSRNLTQEQAAEFQVTRVEKDELLERSDVVTIHMVLSERSRGLIGEAELRKMKRTAYLINTSRGPIVDERALVRALEEGTIAGAGLDVFDEEPLAPDHPLLRAPNAVLTPHVGGFSRESYEIWYGQSVENIKAWMSGKPIRVLGGAVAA